MSRSKIVNASENNAACYQTMTAQDAEVHFNVWLQLKPPDCFTLVRALSDTWLL